MSSHSASITETGSSLIIKIEAHADSSSEEFAFDNIQVVGTVPEPSTYALIAGLLGLSYVMLKRRQG